MTNGAAGTTPSERGTDRAQSQSGSDSRPLPTVTYGSVWEDCDPRMSGRRVKVISLRSDGKAGCVSGYGHNYWGRRVTYISTKRLLSSAFRRYVP